ncbi:3'-5' exoribonuclease 1-like isoform X2 [Anneissia japonica]|uniref:3'-5' exoribonuclease 1-like isoform X2 n=1 Tax=Anneissia japonica TaxID=1529436 RepID=UPI00142552DB|nr:3'-5' exoribonuclease 1-like isoform X2 [Anneissia japonica]XP_033107587.1 3'-5' exoribonuclease 1-like isoform X2 [Anneissia japonica]XP_033107593.1 3'-5' exoribonuclease 1-like isoform X2 [Anneissia japonica]XP_033107602.1 3'-5' exoribonuclease 1-like isoform X2 [Anneissia japonica]
MLRLGDRTSLYYLVCDLEATCIYPPQQDWETEIIEVGAIILNSNLEKVSEFQEYVQPVINANLTPYCLELTKITQADVDRAGKFPEVYGRMLTWMRENGLILQPVMQNFTLITDGVFDCNQYIRYQCIQSKLKYPEWAKSFGNIKKHFTKVLPHTRKADKKSNSITEMLAILNIPMDGQLHRALDDAKLVVKIMKGLRKFRPRFEFRSNEILRTNWEVRFFT